MNAADISTLDIGAWSELWNSLNGQSLGFTLKELLSQEPSNTNGKIHAIAIFLIVFGFHFVTYW